MTAPPSKLGIMNLLHSRICPHCKDLVSSIVPEDATYRYWAVCSGCYNFVIVTHKETRKFTEAELRLVLSDEQASSIYQTCYLMRLALRHSLN